MNKCGGVRRTSALAIFSNYQLNYNQFYSLIILNVMVVVLDSRSSCSKTAKAST